MEIAFPVLLQLFIIARCATPEFHAVVITSEIIKSPVECDEGEDDIFTKVNTTERLKDLRWLMRNENVSAYIVLSNDEHQVLRRVDLYSYKYLRIYEISFISSGKYKIGSL